MRAPLVIPAVLFLDAIAVAREDPHGGALAFTVLAVAVTFAGRSLAHGVAVVALAAGFLAGWWRGDPPSVRTEVAHATIAGTVVSDIEPHAWGLSFELISLSGARFAVTLRQPVAIGERLVLAGRIEPFDEPRNPEEPSSRLLASERGLAGRISAARIVARNPVDPYDLRSLGARCRDWAAHMLEHRLEQPDATILAGMLFGARGALPSEMRAEFQDTGTVHILVTAGLHLGVVAAVFTWLLARLGAGRIGAALGAIPIVWLYCVLSGAHLPSLRAATMASIALLARALGERAFSLNTLAVAAIAVGAMWPASVGGASFALSFSCVAAIALFAEPIASGLEPLRLPSILREALALTFATQIGVWPLTAATFLVIAPYAPLANLLVVPVVGVALVGGLALLAVGGIPPAAIAAAHIESWPLVWIETAVHLTARLPFAHVVATPPPPWTIAVYDAAMIAVALLLRRGPGPQPRIDASAAGSPRSP